MDRRELITIGLSFVFVVFFAGIFAVTAYCVQESKIKVADNPSEIIVSTDLDITA